MKFLLIILLLISGYASAQTIYYIRADSTRLEKIGGNNELILKNGTRSRTGGYLKNTFDGRTGFFYAVDSAYISGGNLVLVRGGGTQNVTVAAGGVGGYNSNVGSGYRWAIPNTNNIKTLLAGTNITIDSSVANTLTINASTAASTVPISGLTAATALNSIDNLDFQQRWDWSTLTQGNGLIIASSSTTAQVNSQKLFIVSLGGANATSTQKTYAAEIGNSHTGTSSTNVGLNVFALAGTNNYAITVASGGGSVGIGTITPAKIFHTVGTVRHATLGTASADTTTYKPMGIDANGDVFPMTYWPGGGGGSTSPAGNFGNLQINRNGAFATPGSDSLDFESATGLTVKGNITSSTLTSGRVAVVGTAGLIKDFAGLTYDGANLLITAAGGIGTGLTITSTNAASYASANFITPTGGNGFQIGKYGASGTVPDGVFFYNPDNSPITFTTNNNRIMDVTGAGNLLLGGTTDPASAYYTIGLHNGGAPTGSLTNGVIIYSEDVAASAELKVRDEAGNITVLSPHHFEGIPMGKSEDMAWSYYSERDGKYITVDMLKAIRTIEDLTRRVEKLEKELNMKSKKPVKLVYTGKVKAKKPVPINKQP